VTPTSSGEHVQVLDLAQLKPYFSISILECAIEDTSRAFETLMRFLKQEAEEPGRSIDVSVTGEIVVGGNDSGSIEDMGSLSSSDLTGFMQSLVAEPKPHLGQQKNPGS
jgi:hypothetical protein